MSLFSLSFMTGVEPLPYIPQIPQIANKETRPFIKAFLNVGHKSFITLMLIARSYCFVLCAISCHPFRFFLWRCIKGPSFNLFNIVIIQLRTNLLCCHPQQSGNYWSVVQIDMTLRSLQRIFQHIATRFPRIQGTKCQDLCLWECTSQDKILC